MVLASLGRIDDAIGAFRRAVSLRPNSPEVLNNLGAALREKKHLDEAINFLQQAITLRPDYPEAFYNLGVALQERGKPDDAIVAFEKATTLRPGYAKPYAHLGGLLLKRDRAAEAADAYRMAVRLSPDSADAWHGLGCAFQHMANHEQAIEHYRKALSLRPDLTDAHYNLGHIAQEAGRAQEAIAHYTRAWSLQPTLVEAANNLAILLSKSEQFVEAERVLNEAVRARPDLATTYNNLGNVLQDMGRYDEAIAAFAKALALKPDYADAKFNQGFLLLARGDLIEGWSCYEARLRRPGLLPDPGYIQPNWDGSDLNGRTILLHAEQGFGDTIQFVRYAPMVRDRGGHVLLLCPRPLHRLFQGRLVIEKVLGAQDSLPEFDVQCPLLSLPGRFETSLQTIPAPIPYLAADENLKAQWLARLSREPGRLKVGIAWAGNPTHQKDKHRSMPLEALDPLARFKDEVRFISLQKGEAGGRNQERLDLVDWTGELNDFADTAALIANLDLVIAVDTAVAHLAGAMGKPVWLLLAIPTDWRWLLDRSDSPWYPTARLFRQPTRGDWQTPVNQLADALAELLGGSIAGGARPT
jgi:tetratricopeptide (TPR) repeat protein